MKQKLKRFRAIISWVRLSPFWPTSGKDFSAAAKTHDMGNKKWKKWNDTFPSGL